MKKIVLFLFLNFIAVNFLYSKKLTFPIEIPQDSFDKINISNKNNQIYEVTYTYDIKKIKNKIKQDNFSVIITAPQSNAFQKTLIRSIRNFSIKEIKKDSIGNNIIISEKIPVSPDINTLKITYEITRFTADEKNTLTENSKKILEYIKNFKALSDKKTSPIDRIYNDKTMSFYPIADDFYYYSSLMFLNYISKENITGKICNAYYIPYGNDYYKKDFIIQLFISGAYILTLDKHLNILNNNGNYIYNNYNLKNLQILENDLPTDYSVPENILIINLDAKNINKIPKKELIHDQQINDFQKVVLDRAYNFLGMAPYTQVTIKNKKFILDCLGFIAAIFYSIDFDIQKEISPYKGRNGVSKFFNYLYDKKMLHQNKIPSPGDIIIWDNTWDFNNDGLFGNDLLTHAGLVVKVEADGTIHYVHVHIKNGIVIEKLNLYKPNQRFDENGKEINSPMHAQSGLNFKKNLPYLSGELWKSNAVFLKKSSK